MRITEEVSFTTLNEELFLSWGRNMQTCSSRDTACECGVCPAGEAGPCAPRWKELETTSWPGRTLPDGSASYEEHEPAAVALRGPPSQAGAGGVGEFLDGTEG